MDDCGYNYEFSVMNDEYHDLEIKIEQLETMNKAKELTGQQLIDAGLNVFGLKLFLESLTGKRKEQKSFESFSFIYHGVKITFEQEE